MVLFKITVRPILVLICSICKTCPSFLFPKNKEQITTSKKGNNFFIWSWQLSKLLEGKENGNVQSILFGLPSSILA